MRSALRQVQNWPLPLAIFGGVGLVISFLGPFFTTSVRWFLVGLVLVTVLLKRRSLEWLQSTAGIIISVYLVWGVMTTLWSLQPQLSFMKSGALVLVAVALVSAGYRWAQASAPREALTFLLPLMLVALLAGLLGKTSTDAYVSGTGVTLYRGLTGNSNMFGSLMFMILPVMLWRAHLGRGRRRFAWALLLAVALAMLLLSVARSSILAAMILIAIYGFSLSLARRTAIFFFGILGIVSVVLMMPSTLEGIEARYVRKNVKSEESSIAFSREGPWSVSLRMARQGGLIGAGYGVSIDSAGRFEGGLTSFGYGREKGNTQLAIVEETGLVGLALHLLIVVAVIARLGRAFKRATDQNLRTLVGIVLGAIIGELVVGIFEAWWVAPGAPESIWFWTMVGVALGLSDAVLRTVAVRSPRAIGAGPALQANPGR